MQYKKIKNADLIVGSSKYLVKNPQEYQKRWHEAFKNNNPIYIVLTNFAKIIAFIYFM